MLNTHGLKMVGLKKAVGEMVNWSDQRVNNVIYYDRNTGDIMCRTHTQNSWDEWHDPAIICAARTPGRMTMQQLADAIAQSVRDAEDREWERDQGARQ